MGESRQPHFVFLLRNQGKKTFKLELFKSTLWGNKGFMFGEARGKVDRAYYRLRVNGKWFNYQRVTDGKIAGFYQYSFFTRSEIRDLLWRSLSGKF